MSRSPIHCAAVDLGATSGRVVVGTWRDNRLETNEVHRFPNQFRALGPHVYWDLPGLWQEVLTGLRAARAAYPRLASVGVDTWAVDHVLVNRAGRPVYPVHAYRDGRTDRLARQLTGDAFAAVYAATGIPGYPYNTSLQLQETLAAAPGIAASAARCLFLPDYFNFLLSGRMENEVSIASHSQLLGLEGAEWSPTALAHFGVPGHWFSRPLTSPRVLGPVRGVPELRGVRTVLVPGHDTACAFAAMPAAVDGGDVYVSSGTWSLIGFEHDAPLADARARAARISNERMGDGRFRPLRSNVGLWLLEQVWPAFTAKRPTAASWRRLVAVASARPAPARLLDVSDRTLFAPENMRAAIDAQLRRHRATAPRDLPGYVRLICDSLGAAHAESVRLLATLSGRTFRRVLIVGGGSKNRLLCQATADACRLPVVSYSLEGSAVGNLASQLVALGAVPNLAAFRALFSAQLRGLEFKPRP